MKAFIGRNKFNIISWGITLALTAGIVFGGLAWKQSANTVQALAPQPTAAPAEEKPDVAMPAFVH
jgi:hypothetical protein